MVPFQNSFLSPIQLHNVSFQKLTKLAINYFNLSQLIYPLSNKLYDILEKAYDTQPEKPKHEFQIDLMKNKMPTYDQYKLIVDKYLKGSTSKTILHNCFPFLHDSKTELYNSKGNVVTVKVLNGQTRLLSGRVSNDL